MIALSVNGSRHLFDRDEIVGFLCYGLAITPEARCGAVYSAEDSKPGAICLACLAAPEVDTASDFARAARTSIRATAAEAP